MIQAVMVALVRPNCVHQIPVTGCRWISPILTKYAFNPETGEARATLDRDLDAGRHLATVIVVHDSGRLYPEAIIFTTTAP
jgi:hypothetical protein